MEKVKVSLSPREIESLLNVTNDEQGLYVRDARRELLRVTRYAKYALRPWSQGLVEQDFWYVVTFGHMQGLMVHADDDVLTFDGGIVVLGVDSDWFFDLHPEFKEEDE